MSEKHIGEVVQVIGPVLDIRFGHDELPALLNAIEIDHEGTRLTAEVAQQIGDNTVRCIAMNSTDGLVRGTKAVEYSKRNGFACVTESFGEIADVSVADCFEMANLLCGEFKKGEFGHIDLCYTKFVSMLSQQPSAIPVLPLKDLTDKQDTKSIRNLILYEPDASEVFDAIVPEYLAGLIYGAVCESVASELAARRTAMEAATNNAEEMIEKLNLHYNRARQASITQEITEIVGGAEGV